MPMSNHFDILKRKLDYNNHDIPLGLNTVISDFFKDYKCPKLKLHLNDPNSPSIFLHSDRSISDEYIILVIPQYRKIDGNINILAISIGIYLIRQLLRTNFLSRDFVIVFPKDSSHLIDWLDKIQD
jgi:hypothetical protein